MFDDNVVGQLINNTNPEAILDPKYSFKGVNDDVNSVCWLPGSETDLLAATEDNLKICDTRSPWINNKLITEKRIQEIKFDPFDDYRFACMTQNSIKIFDIRIIQKPQFQLRDEYLVNFEWSLQRPDLLASFNRNSDLVKLWDINCH